MRVVNIKQVQALIDPKCNASLIIKAFSINNITTLVQWINKDSLEEISLDYINLQGWDPERALVLYCEPPDKKPDSEHKIAEQISKLNYTDCICMFFENMTLEEFVHKINQIATMRAFL